MIARRITRRIARKTYPTAAAVAVAAWVYLKLTDSRKKK